MHGDAVTAGERADLDQFDAGVKSADPLKFVDSQPYPDRIKRYEKESGLPEAVICGTAKIGGIPVSLAVMDFRFCGGAMGAAATLPQAAAPANRRIQSSATSSRGAARAST